MRHCTPSVLYHTLFTFLCMCFAIFAFCFIPFYFYIYNFGIALEVETTLSQTVASPHGISNRIEPLLENKFLLIRLGNSKVFKLKYKYVVYQIK